MIQRYNGMNLYFFYTAICAYVLAAAGYIAFIMRPGLSWTARVSFWCAACGFLLHLGFFGVRWFESGRLPITNFFEASSFLGMGIVLVFLFLELRFKIAALGSFLLPLVILLMIPALASSGEIRELNPLLKSGWLGVHTSLSVLGDAAFAFSCIVSIMYLIQERQLKAKSRGVFFHRLPSLELMDTLAYRALTFGWPLFTLGIVSGSIWANSAWGTYWNWDPKETSSLVTWVVYLVLLHLRTVGWRGRKMAFLSILGFVFVLISFYVVTRLPMGKHGF